MKKTVYISLLIVIAISSFLIGQRYPNNAESTTTVSVQDIQPNISNEPQHKNKTTKASEQLASHKLPIEKTKKPEESQTKSREKADKLEIHEEALSSLVDGEELQQEVGNVYNRFENEPSTQAGENLQADIKNKMFNDGVYDELLSQNIEFSDAECRLSLCKLEFKVVDKNMANGSENIKVIGALDSNFLNFDDKARLYSKEEDGKISFYVGRGFLSQ